jgi:hypothetical protein
MRIGPDDIPMGALWVGVLGLALTALMITALVQIAKHPAIDPTARAVWILIVLVAPVLGAVAWFWAGPKEIGHPSRPK